MAEVLSSETVAVVRRGGGTVREVAQPAGGVLGLLVDEPDRHETAKVTHVRDGGLVKAVVEPVARGVGPAPDGADRVETRYR